MNKIINRNSSDNFYIYGKHPIFITLQNSKRKFYKIYTSNIDELKSYIKNNRLNINENIIEYKNNISSFVQIRGNIPLIWKTNEEESFSAYKPK